MEHSIMLEPGGRWVSVRYVGVISLDDVRALHDRMMRKSWWSPNLPRLFDYEAAVLAEISFLDASQELLPYMQAHAERLFGDGRVPQAHVCSDDMKRALLHYWLRISEEALPVRGRMFRRRLEAEDWLLDAVQPELALV